MASIFRNEETATQETKMKLTANDRGIGVRFIAGVKGSSTVSRQPPVQYVPAVLFLEDGRVPLTSM
jgi:hypothetical protein